MDRLISENEDCVRRANLISKLEILERRYGSDFYWETRKIVDKLPSVKPQEKTGHWIWQTEDIYQCSECGEDIHVKEVMNEPQYICCPMCGCPMEIER